MPPFSTVSMIGQTGVRIFERTDSISDLMFADIFRFDEVDEGEINLDLMTTTLPRNHKIVRALVLTHHVSSLD